MRVLLVDVLLAACQWQATQATAYRCLGGYFLKPLRATFNSLVY